MTKIEILEKLNAIAEIGNASCNGYHYEVKANDWNNYGKNRTYFSIVETRDFSKHNKEKKYGFYDNAADNYVGNENDFQYTFSGARI